VCSWLARYPVKDEGHDTAKAADSGCLRASGAWAIIGPPPHQEEAMSDLKKKFDKAVSDVKTLKEDPDNATKLELYALFKQVSSGDVEGKRPGFTDMVGRAKFDAWAALKGTSPDAAMKQYADLVNGLLKG
jgi:acyl-CoA-binding protein